MSRNREEKFMAIEYLGLSEINGPLVVLEGVKNASYEAVSYTHLDVYKRQEITCTYGEKFDMLNLQFIQRSKRYYNMDPASIYALLIPVNYKLKKEEITALVEAPSYEEGRRIFQKTWYGNKYEQLTVANLEEFYNHIHRSILEKESHRNPYSVAVIYSYLYNKEHEVNRLTIAIECVRYGVQHDEAMRYICNS